jgi:hypothetical protein
LVATPEAGQTAVCLSCTQTSDTQPESLFELELGLVGVDEAKFTLRMIAAKLAVALHRGSTIRTDFYDCDAIENAVVVLAVRLECLDDEPLIGMSRADFTPQHDSR